MFCLEKGWWLSFKICNALGSSQTEISTGGSFYGSITTALLNTQPWVNCWWTWTVIPAMLLSLLLVAGFFCRSAYPSLAAQLDLALAFLLLPINETFLSPTLSVNVQLSAKGSLHSTQNLHNSSLHSGLLPISSNWQPYNRIEMWLLCVIILHYVIDCTVLMSSWTGGMGL